MGSKSDWETMRNRALVLAEQFTASKTGSSKAESEEIHKHVIQGTQIFGFIDSLEAVATKLGAPRASFLLARIEARAEALGIPNSGLLTTPYLNTIPPADQPWFPGDEMIERRIRAVIRWNAVAMVVRANHRAEGIGGQMLRVNALGCGDGKSEVMLVEHLRRSLPRPPKLELFLRDFSHA